MKKIGFIGAYDKIDMLLNVAKILTALNNKVLVVDSTVNQKARYIIPSINPTVSYITSFEDIDIAIGFDTEEQIKNYIGISDELPYDIVLVDVDAVERVEWFDIEKTSKNFFVTAFDMYSLKRGVEILSGIQETTEITKILFTKEILKEDNDYLNFLSSDCNVKWDEERIYFPIENGDSRVIAENQRVQKIKFKKLSAQYKDNLNFITQEILEENSDSKIRKAIKIIERGV